MKAKRFFKSKKKTAKKKQESIKSKDYLRKKKKPTKKRVTVADMRRRIYSIARNRMQISHLRDYLEKAGLDVDEAKISAMIYKVALFFNFILSFYLIFNFFTLDPELAKTSIIYFGIWSFILVFTVFILWLVIYLIIDFRVRIRANRRAKAQGISVSKAYKIELSIAGQGTHLSDYIENAGLNLNIQTIGMLLFRFAIIVNLVLNAYLFHNFSSTSPNLVFTIIVTALLWLLGFFLMLLLLWAIFFIWVDLRVYNRKKEIEEVLPDFLQLTSANISGGMTIDKALWFAVRPRFGVLAKEIEDVAKSTIVGDNLNTALLKFAKKYKSKVLQRSVNLLIEGMDSGGELGELLNRISTNIQETRIIKKEMAANVTTYVIFISFATIVAAPMLFGLSTELIVIMKSILGGINQGVGGDSMGGVGSMFSFSADAISLKDYQYFAIAALTVSASASAALTSIIKNGNIKDGLKSFPIYITVTLVLYFIIAHGMHILLGSMF